MRSDDRQANQPSPEVPLVSPVHGTFDDTPTWFGIRSTFESVFEKRLGWRGFELCPLYWSAKNTFRSRLAGALMLRRKIVGLGPREGLYLISHSHGGNVSLKATDTEALERVRHVTIGTPFLSLESESLHLPVAVLWSIAIMAAFTWSAEIAVSIFRLFAEWSAPAAIPFNLFTGLLLLLATIVLVICLVFAVVSFAIFAPLIMEKMSENRRDRTTVALVNVKPFNGKMLCVYTRWDEAYIALRVSVLALRVLGLAMNGIDLRSDRSHPAARPRPQTRGD